MDGNSSAKDYIHLLLFSKNTIFNREFVDLCCMHVSKVR